jgi:hypothetical protein
LTCTIIVSKKTISGHVNYWLGYVDMIWTDERKFSEKKTISGSPNPVMAQGKQELSGCHHSPQPLYIAFILCKKTVSDMHYILDICNVDSQ